MAWLWQLCLAQQPGTTDPSQLAEPEPQRYAEEQSEFAPQELRLRNEFSSIRHSHRLRLQPQRQLQSEGSSYHYRMLAHRIGRLAKQTRAHLLVEFPQLLLSSAIFLPEPWLPLDRMTCCWCRG